MLQKIFLASRNDNTFMCTIFWDAINIQEED